MTWIVQSSQKRFDGMKFVGPADEVATAIHTRLVVVHGFPATDVRLDDFTDQLFFWIRYPGKDRKWRKIMNVVPDWENMT